MNMQTKQKGVVLVIGLMMLLLMTVIGVSSISSTTDTEQSTGNNQFSTISFQAAESAIAFENTIPRLNASAAASATNYITAPQMNNYDVDVSGTGAMLPVTGEGQVSYCGEDPATIIGSSLNLNSTTPKFHAHDVNGTGQINNVGARQRHVQRSSKPGPNLGIAFNDNLYTAGNCVTL